MPGAAGSTSTPHSPNRSNCSATFLRAYLAEAQGQRFLPETSDELIAVLNLAMLQKVLYELNYELNNRPDWVSIPLRGLLDVMGKR